MKIFHFFFFALSIVTNTERKRWSLNATNEDVKNGSGSVNVLIGATSIGIGTAIVTTTETGPKVLRQTVTEDMPIVVNNSLNFESRWMTTLTTTQMAEDTATAAKTNEDRVVVEAIAIGDDAGGIKWKLQ